MYKTAKPLPSVETLNELLTVDSSSPTGLTWKVNRRGTAKAGSTAGSQGSSGAGVPYYQVRVNSNIYLAHRVIWKIANGKDPENVIDHIDNNPLNNSVSNLRDVTQRENLLNRRDYKERENDRSFTTYVRNLFRTLAS